MEMLLRSGLDADRFAVLSAGIQGWDQSPMDADAAAQLERLGGDGSAFRSQPITAALIKSASLILTATREHRSGVLDVSPGALRRAFTLREFAALAPKVETPSLSTLVTEAARMRSQGPADADIADPYRGGADVHEVIAEEISESVTTVCEVLNRITAR